jgi:Tol biopolymer transport system component
VVLGVSVAAFAVLGHVFPRQTGVQPGGGESTLPRNGLIAYSDANPRTGDGDIFTMRPDGTDVSVLHQPGDDYDPEWSPDGDRIFFMKDGHGIWTMKADGSDAVQLSTVDTSWLAVSPDGSRIAFDQPPSRISVMNVDGTDSHVIYDTSHPVSGEPPSNGNASGAVGRDGKVIVVDHSVDHPTWSPDGSHIAFSYDSSIWVMDADGSNPHELLASGVSPVWSPDGGRIAFLSPDLSAIESATVGETASGQIAASRPSEVATAQSGSFRDLAFSPDATMLLYTHEPSTDGPQNFDVFMIAVGGGPATRLTDLARDEQPWCCLDPDWQPVAS